MGDKPRTHTQSVSAANGGKVCQMTYIRRVSEVIYERFDTEPVMFPLPKSDYRLTAPK